MICQHRFIPARTDYEVCELCGTYHSTLKFDRNAIYLDEYWSSKHEHSTIDEQVHNVAVHKEDGVTKNEFVLARINPPDFSVVVEIGCAPGKLLGELGNRFSQNIGLEIDDRYAADIQRIANFPNALFFGMFPESTKSFEGGTTSCIIGLDIIEHADDPVPFLAECNRLLKTGGQLLLMTPLVGEDLPERMFHPEHVWIFSPWHMKELCIDAGFSDPDFGAWCPGHETVSAIKL